MTNRGKAESRFTKLQGDGLLSFGKFGRFLVVGLLNAAAGFLLFLFFSATLGFHYLVANVFVFVSWVWFGFESQRRYAFQAPISIASFCKYFFNQIVFLGISSVVIWTLVEVFTAPAELSFLLALGIVTVGMYLSSLLWVFRETDTSRE